MANQDVAIIADAGGSVIELSNSLSDPGSWIVRRWKKVLCFRKRISSDWFLDKDQAMAFAVKMKRELERSERIPPD